MNGVHVSGVLEGSWLRRLVAAGVTLFALAWLGVGTQLEPAVAGAGTHQQLGLAACAFHADLNMPCPTCGMTTAFALATQGQVIDAARVQPGGALFALLLAMGVWVGTFVAVTGSPLAPLVRPIRVHARGVLLALGGILVVSWLIRLAAG